MRSLKALLLGIAVAVLAGCEASRSLSTVQDEHAAYAVTGVEAKRIVDGALANYVPAKDINSGAQAGVMASGSLVEGTRIQAISVSALPVSGINSAGQIKEGYGFVVTDRGDVINELMPKMIFGLVKQQAAISGEVLATAKPGQE